MATRLSTAEILAAARTGKKNGAVVALSEAVTSGLPDNSTDSGLSGNGRFDRAAAEQPTAPLPATGPDSAAANGSGSNRNGDVPASVAGILSKVRSQREGSTPAMNRPHSIAAILEQIRGGAGPQSSSPAVPASVAAILRQVREIGTASSGIAADRPASIAAILAEVRGASSPETVRTEAPTTEKTVVAAAPRSGGRLSTADILAAARTKKAAGSGTGSAKPTEAAAPAGDSPRKMSTAEILAAARAKTSGNPGEREATTTSGMPRPAPATARSSKKLGATRPETTEVASDDGKVRPKSVATILDAVRFETRQAEAGSLPGLSAMIAEMRRHETANAPPAMRPGDGNWASRLLRWISGDGQTYRGASI